MNVIPKPINRKPGKEERPPRDDPGIKNNGKFQKHQQNPKIKLDLITLYLDCNTGRA